MLTEIVYTSIFIKKAKLFKKKFHSLTDELKQLEANLLLEPQTGTALGSGLYKIRLAVNSKSKGKSGGFRIITYLISNNDDAITINMLTIYDKSEESSIDKKVLQ